MDQDPSTTLPIEEEIEKLANFILTAFSEGLIVWEFEQLEEELWMAREDIISVFDLFRAAKIFSYSITPSGGFIIGVCFNPQNELGIGMKFETPVSVNREALKKLRSSHSERVRFLKKYGKHFHLPASVADGEKTVGSLKFNLETGDFIYRETRGSLSPKTQEFKVLSSLVRSSSRPVTYDSIVKAVWPGIEKANKANRQDLYTIVKNIKKKLAILPKSADSNPDIIKTSPRFGYRLLDENP